MLVRVTIDQANRHVFAKQHLAAGSRGRNLLPVVRDIGPIRATPALTPYLSLWSRIEDFRREDLETALHDSRSLVRVLCMQARLYLLLADEYPVYFQATKPLLQHGLCDLDDLLSETSNAQGQDSPMPSYDLAQRVLEILSTRGPCTVDELADLLPLLNARVLHDPGRPKLGYSRIGTRLIPAMCAEGLLVRAQTRGGWRSDLWSYTALSSWLPAMDLKSLAHEEALRRVVSSYVAAFGPVTVGDVSYWLGGLARRQVAAVLMALSDRLVRLQIMGSQGEYFLLKEDLEALLGEVPAERSVCLLPPRDSYAMAYSDSGRFLPATYRERVYDRAGEALGTVWADGYVVGLWWLHLKEERISVRFFELADPETMALVGEEALRLGRFLEARALDIEIGSFAEDEWSEEGAPAPLAGMGRP